MRRFFLNKIGQKISLVAGFLIIIVVFFVFNKKEDMPKSVFAIIASDVFSPYSACVFVNDKLLISSAGLSLYFIDTESLSLLREMKFDRHILNISLSNDKKTACLYCSGKFVILNLETFEFYDKDIAGRLIEWPGFVSNNELVYVTVMSDGSKINKFNCETKKCEIETCPFVSTYPFYLNFSKNKITMLAKKSIYVFDYFTLKKIGHIVDEKISSPCRASICENDFLLVSSINWFKIYDIKSGFSVAEKLIPKNEYIHWQFFLEGEKIICLNLNSGYGRPSTLLFYKLLDNGLYVLENKNNFQRFSFSISPNESLFAESGFLNGHNVISIFKTKDILSKIKKA